MNYARPTCEFNLFACRYGPLLFLSQAWFTDQAGKNRVSTTGQIRHLCLRAQVLRASSAAFFAHARRRARVTLASLRAGLSSSSPAALVPLEVHASFGASYPLCFQRGADRVFFLRLPFNLWLDYSARAARTGNRNEFVKLFERFSSSTVLAFPIFLLLIKRFLSII